MELAEARLHELLPLEGGLVFGILPEIAQLDGLGNGLGKRHVEFMAEHLDFPAQLLPHLADHDSGAKKSLPGEHWASPGAEVRLSSSDNTPRTPVPPEARIAASGRRTLRSVRTRMPVRRRTCSFR